MPLAPALCGQGARYCNYLEAKFHLELGMIAMLLERPASPCCSVADATHYGDATNTLPNSACILAFDVLHTMMASRVDINSKDEDGNTELHEAVIRVERASSLGAITLPLSSAIDVNAPNSLSRPAIFLAHTNKVMNLLIEGKAAVADVDHQGMTIHDHLLGREISDTRGSIICIADYAR